MDHILNILNFLNYFALLMQEESIKLSKYPSKQAHLPEARKVVCLKSVVLHEVQ